MDSLSQKPSVLVTGGAGFIGSHLVERLLFEGYEVTVIDDASTGSIANLQAVASHSGLKVYQCKVSQCPDLDRIVKKSGFIYHLAAAVGVDLVLKSPIRTIATNLHETQAILEAASRASVPVLLASTSEVYGKSDKPVFSEDDDLLIGPPHLVRWSYACSKLMDEFLALAYFKERKLPIIIARLFNTVGPRQTGRYGMVLPRFVLAALNDQPLAVFGAGTQTRCFCYVLDTVEALFRLQHCQAARGEIFNIGGTNEISIRELAERVVSVLHSSSVIKYVGYSQAYESGFEDMLRRKPNISKVRRLTGFRPGTGLSTIIKKTAAALEKQRSSGRNGTKKKAPGRAPREIERGIKCRGTPPG